MNCYTVESFYFFMYNFADYNLHTSEKIGLYLKYLLDSMSSAFSMTLELYRASCMLYVR